jgi:hypothetical protein
MAILVRGFAITASRCRQNSLWQVVNRPITIHDGYGKECAELVFVVPCYNFGRFLAVCVRSVLDQSMDDLRGLIIDD